MVGVVVLEDISDMIGTQVMAVIRISFAMDGSCPDREMEASGSSSCRIVVVDDDDVEPTRRRHCTVPSWPADTKRQLEAEAPPLSLWSLETSWSATVANALTRP